MAINHDLPYDAIDLGRHGEIKLNRVYRNLTTPRLYEEASRRNEGMISNRGALVVRTGPPTARSPCDKFIVRDPYSQEHIWWGDVNHIFRPDDFEKFLYELTQYLREKDIFVQDCWACAAPEHRLAVRVITSKAWHSLVARNLLIQPTSQELEIFVPKFTIIDCPGFRSPVKVESTNSDIVVVFNLAKRLVIICGTCYSGEIKKSVFTMLNYLLPLDGVLPMHCAANYGLDRNTALFFGLSGTGKTSLSGGDFTRTLIGDDEHGWGSNGVFNLEGGCYARVRHLSKEREPEIYAFTHRFGAVLENVVIDSVSRQIDFFDTSLSENMRAAYPISYVPNADLHGQDEHPKNIFFLSADAFGIFPPVAKLSAAQALYHFLSGYTSKIGGTEKGIVVPQATFSACFSAPFLVQHPIDYVKLLWQKIGKHHPNCWLINTGWSGGPYGVGERIPIAITRAITRAAMAGTLDNEAYTTDPIFGFRTPSACPGVPSDILVPRNTWLDPSEFDHQAKNLAERIGKNFYQFEAKVPHEIKVGGPVIQP
jgi:phosphoenolpyruvate carboxykinase (ATP)